MSTLFPASFIVKNKLQSICLEAQSPCGQTDVSYTLLVLQCVMPSSRTTNTVPLYCSSSMIRLSPVFSSARCHITAPGTDCTASQVVLKQPTAAASKLIAAVFSRFYTLLNDK